MTTTEFLRYFMIGLNFITGLMALAYGSDTLPDRINQYFAQKRKEKHEPNRNFFILIGILLIVVSTLHLILALF